MAKHETFEWNWYWAVDAVGLREDGAERLAEAARRLDGVIAAEAFDPCVWYHHHWTRSDVDEVCRRLAACPPDHGHPDNLRNGMVDWIDATTDATPEQPADADGRGEQARSDWADDARRNGDVPWYWWVDAVGLDRSGASRLATLARQLGGVSSAMPIDPRRRLTRGWDRHTTRDVWSRLGATATDADSVRDRLGEWLDATVDEPPDGP